MKYAVEMGSGAIIYIPSFIKIGSGIQKLMGGGSLTGTQTAWRSHKPTLGKQANRVSAKPQCLTAVRREHKQ
jgi:hypothetical protein